MTQNENETVRKTRSRTRKDQMDLRKKVLKDQTCRHLNYSPVNQVREKAPTKLTGIREGKLFLQPDQINMAVLFWYLVISNLSNLHYWMSRTLDKAQDLYDHG